MIGGAMRNLIILLAWHIFALVEMPFRGEDPQENPL
jgi:hypothetical protein